MYSVTCDLQDNRLRPAAGAQVEIRSRLLEISRGELVLSTTYQGLRRLLFSHPVLAAVVGISINAAFILMVLLAGLVTSKRLSTFECWQLFK